MSLHLALFQASFKLLEAALNSLVFCTKINKALLEDSHSQKQCLLEQQICEFLSAHVL